MQDIHLVGGQFIESIGKSIEEVSPNPFVDNVTLLDAADGLVLIVFLIIFMMVFVTLSVGLYISTFFAFPMADMRPCAVND